MEKMKKIVMLGVMISGIELCAAQDLRVEVGHLYTIETAEDAVGATEYRWYENGHLLPNVSGATFSKINYVSGLYTYVRAANLGDECGWRASNGVVVDVIPPVDADAPYVMEGIDVAYCLDCCYNGAYWVDCWVTREAYPFGQAEATPVAWSASTAQLHPGACTDKNGRAATNSIITTSPSPLHICKDLGEGWYLPAYEELYAMSAGVAHENSNNKPGRNILKQMAHLLPEDTKYWTTSQCDCNKGRYTPGWYVQVMVDVEGGFTGADPTGYVHCAWRP
jgi:hypothetical protein